MTAEAQKENVAEAVFPGDPPKETAHPGKGAAPSSRERSTIEFPYSHLEDAEQGAKALFGEAGTTAVTLAQAAAAMGQSASSSTFRVRLATMRIFGLLENEGGKVWLTEVGRAISEAQTTLDARAKAFARIPLYAKVIEAHDGKTLPSAGALEKEFAAWGVARKQTERARQVFERSAKWAGYIKPGSDRFVSPIMRGGQEAPDSVGSDKPAMQNPGNGGGGGGRGLDPVIQALVQKIPVTGAPWGIDEQVMWLRMMAMAFNMTFGGKRSIKIDAEPDATRDA